MEVSQGIMPYIKEYVAITKFLKGEAEKGTEKVFLSKDFICLSREDVIAFLKKNHFETPENKLKIWKTMHWIKTSEGHMTALKKVNGKPVRVIMINTKIAAFLEPFLVEK